MSSRGNTSTTIESAASAVSIFPRISATLSVTIYVSRPPLLFSGSPWYKKRAPVPLTTRSDIKSVLRTIPPTRLALLLTLTRVKCSNIIASFLINNTAKVRLLLQIRQAVFYGTTPSAMTHPKNCGDTDIVIICGVLKAIKNHFSAII